MVLEGPCEQQSVWPGYATQYDQDCCYSSLSLSHTIIKRTFKHLCLAKALMQLRECKIWSVYAGCTSLKKHYLTLMKSNSPDHIVWVISMTWPKTLLLACIRTKTLQNQMLLFFFFFFFVFSGDIYDSLCVSWCRVCGHLLQKKKKKKKKKKNAFHILWHICLLFHLYLYRNLKLESFTQLDLTTYRIYRMFSDRQAWASSVDPNETPQNAASHQGLHCLPLIQQFKTQHRV